MQNNRYEDFDRAAGRRVVAELRARGITESRMACDVCNGTGRVQGRKCRNCEGEGYLVVVI